MPKPAKGKESAIGFAILICFFALAFPSVAPVSLWGQRQEGKHQAPQSCPGRNCDNVRVDDVSLHKLNASVSKKSVGSITVTGGKGLYVLSCSWPFVEHCVAPAIGKQYRYSESSSNENGSHRLVHLAGPGTLASEYELEAFVPQVSSQDVLSLLRACETKNRFIGPEDCALWLRRQFALRNIPCPEPEATTGCQSFQELVAAGDPEIMDDLATRDHVYVCFLPRNDEFFEITFSEPGFLSWSHPDQEENQKGIPDDYLLAPGLAQLIYFKDGLVDAQRTFQEEEHWVFAPIGHQNDMSYLEKYANSDTSRFEGRNIHIELGRFDLSEEFKNMRNTQTTQTISVQLATGRFTEKYEASDSGILNDSVSGRCMIAPNDKY